jgi:DDE family transposase/transposase-like protein DUF772
MSVGMTPRQTAMLGSTTGFCESRIAADSIYGLLHRECHRLFADELFADLFCDGRGRRSVPPMIVAVVMVLQRIEGCSDREAVDRFTYDARWKYACGGLDLAYPGFVHTVLVDMRARLAASERPERIFEVVLETARAAGLVGRRRVLDSTALYDAVATMDTVTLVRSAIRGLLAVCDSVLEAELRGVLVRDDDYRAAGKPVCDYDDSHAREQLVDALAKDARALLGALDGRELSTAVAQAGALLAAVAGQDLDQGQDGVFRIARRVAKDRVISTVDPEARHGHKTTARGFDGYKGHVAEDPDSELITATAVTAGNIGDAQAAQELLASELEDPEAATEQSTEIAGAERLAVYGDAAYGSGELLDLLAGAGAEANCKTQLPTAPSGRFAKDAFEIDLEHGAVRCPAGQITGLRAQRDGSQLAYFGPLCTGCLLAARCTNSPDGRTIRVGPHERHLAAARQRQADPAWKADYKATRPKVERKLGHMMRRKHGGRRARVRGQAKVHADFNLLAAATNLARLAVLGLRHDGANWATTPA